MDVADTGGIRPPLGMAAGLAVWASLPASIGLAVAAALGIWRAKVDAHVQGALDRFLAGEAAALRARVGPRLLDFRTSDSFRALPAGLGWRRVRLYRTIRAALADGYRIRLRAFASGARGRVIVRWVDVELRRKAA